MFGHTLDVFSWIHIGKLYIWIKYENRNDKNVVKIEKIKSKFVAEIIIIV